MMYKFPIIAVFVRWLIIKFLSTLAGRNEKPAKLTLDITRKFLPEASQIKEVARGSTCRVYKVEAENREPLAVKVYATDEFSVKCYMNEIFVDRWNKHQYISHGFAAEGGFYLILMMPYYPQSLDSFIEKASHSENEMKVKLLIAQKLESEIKELHCREIVHCDIKPGNIMLSKSYNEIMAGDLDFNVHLVDFGVSAMDGRGIMKQPGTRHYMAPEVLHREGCDKSSDWWSYGCTIFELLTGRTLFDIYSHDDTLYDVNDAPSDYSSDNSSECSLEPYPDEVEEEEFNYHLNLMDYVAVDAENNIELVTMINMDQDLLSGSEAQKMLEKIKNNIVLNPASRESQYELR